MIRKFFREYAGMTLSWLSSTVMIAVCVSVIAYLIINGIKQVDLNFLLTEPNPTMNEKLSGGISTPIIGTFILTFLGMLFSFPWALITAIYLAEYAEKNKLTAIFRIGIENLAGVPTVVLAIFSIAVFTNPQFAFLSREISSTNKAFGRSFLVAGITMAILVLPFLIKICETALRTVPDSYREASHALGASKLTTTFKIVIPAAKRGIFTAVILSIGRIIGETVIVCITLGGTVRIAVTQPWWSLSSIIGTLKGTGPTLTSYIFFTSPAGEGNLIDNAFGASLVLMVIIFVLNIAISMISRMNRKNETG